MLTDLVALVRHALQPEGELAPYPEQVQARYEAWLAAQEAAGKRSTPSSAGGWTRSPATIGLNLRIAPEDFEIDGEFVDRGGRWGSDRCAGRGVAGAAGRMNEALMRTMKREMVV